MPKKRRQTTKSKLSEEKTTVNKVDDSEEAVKNRDEFSDILSGNIVVEELVNSLKEYEGYDDKEDFNISKDFDIPPNSSSTAENVENEDLMESDLDLDIDQFTTMFDEIKKQAQEDKRRKIRIKQAKLKRLQESRSPVVAAKLNAASKMDEEEQKKALEKAEDIIQAAKEQAKKKSSTSKKNRFSNVSFKNSNFLSRLKNFFTIDDSEYSSIEDDPWAVYPEDQESLSKNSKSSNHEKQDVIKIKDDLYVYDTDDEEDYIIETQDIIEASTDINEDEVNIENEPAKNIIVKKVIKYKNKPNSNKKRKRKHSNINDGKILIIPPRDEHLNDKEYIHKGEQVNLYSIEDVEEAYDRTIQDRPSIENLPTIKKTIENAVKKAQNSNTPVTAIDMINETIKETSGIKSEKHSDKKLPKQKQTDFKNSNHKDSYKTMTYDYKTILKLAGDVYKKPTENKIVIFSGNLENNLMEECRSSFRDSKIGLYNSENTAQENVNESKKEKNQEKVKKKLSKPLKEIDDYESNSDSQTIKKDILKTSRFLLVKTLITFLLFIINFILILIHQLDIPLLPQITENNIIYLSVILASVLMSMTLCKTTIINGLNSLFKFKGNSDSALSFAIVTCILQEVISLIFPASFGRLGYSVYGSLVLLGLFLNCLGKLKIIHRIQRNFKFVSSEEQKYAAKIFTDKKKLEELLGAFRSYDPVVAYQKRTAFLSDFLKLSYERDPVEKTMGKIAPTCALISIASFMVTLFFTKEIIPSVTLLALVSCMSIPMTSILAINSPMLSLCKKALSHGAMIVGYPAVKQFCDTNMIVINANELYPANSIILHGVKSFGNIPIDKVILEAVSVLKRAEAPLSKTLDKLIVNKKEVLPVVVSYEYIDDQGIEACVKGHTVLIGNRKLLENHNIRPPKRDFEKKCAKKDCHLTYVAINNELCAMFIVSYIPNKSMMLEMRKLEDNSVNFLITTRDPNITAKMISGDFKVFFRSIKILDTEQANVFISATDHPELSTRAYLATKGKAISMARFISACIRLKSNITASIITQTMTIALNVCLTLFVSFYMGVEKFSALEICTYCLFWCTVNSLIPRLRKL